MVTDIHVQRPITNRWQPLEKMKHLFILCTMLIAMNSFAQEKFFGSTCDCIDQIVEKSNQAAIAEQVQACFQKSFKNHHNEIGTILENYVKEDPKMDMKSAERNLSKILTTKLSEKCATFKEIDKKLAGQQKNSDQILTVIADEICTELQDKANLTDKSVNPIIIEITKRHQVSVYGQYNLNDKIEMKKYGADLNARLMNECPKYSSYIQKKNSEK